MADEEADRKEYTVQRVPSAIRIGGESCPLLDQVAQAPRRVGRMHRHHKGFFRLLRKGVTSEEHLNTLLQFRDAVVRSTLKKKDEGSGLAVAVAGVEGGEGASFLSLLLALSLGAMRHYRVAFLDGRLQESRFEALTDVLSLSRNSWSTQKGEGEVLGFVNEFQPNVYFLSNASPDKSLNFFADKDLEIFLANLRSSFDFSIIDMPPFLQESANVFVAPAVDRLFLVVSAGKTRMASVDKCIEVAEDAGIEISGVIVNHQRAPFWSRKLWREYFF